MVSSVIVENIETWFCLRYSPVSSHQSFHYKDFCVGECVPIGDMELSDSAISKLLFANFLGKYLSLVDRYLLSFSQPQLTISGFQDSEQLANCLQQANFGVPADAGSFLQWLLHNGIPNARRLYLSFRNSPCFVEIFEVLSFHSWFMNEVYDEFDPLECRSLLLSVLSDVYRDLNEKVPEKITETLSADSVPRYIDVGWESDLLFDLTAGSAGAGPVSIYYAWGDVNAFTERA